MPHVVVLMGAVIVGCVIHSARISVSRIKVNLISGVIVVRVVRPWFSRFRLRLWK